MTFADQLLTETDADVVMVDRRHLPGGHWNDAYSFVHLHQPSACYGVGSRALGSDRIDVAGYNEGYYELASGAEVSGYFQRLMQDRFLPSGRVRWFPLCEHLGDGRFRSLVTGAVHEIEVRGKVVDAAFFDTKVPATHTPSFAVDDGVALATPNALPKAAPGREHFAILGGGKTGMDVGVWLVQMGVAPERILWVLPRDSRIMNRDTTQPGEAFYLRTVGGLACQFEAAALATSVDDLFERLEAAGQLLRIHRDVRPSMYRGATISVREVEMLRAIADVVRLGHVKRILGGAIELDDGRVPAAPDKLYIDCTARAIGCRPPVPVFAGRTVTVQAVRAHLVCLSAAVIAHVEGAYDGDAAKNELCRPIPVASSDVDWLRAALADLEAGRRWGADKALRRFMAEHRLIGATVGGPSEAARGAEAERVRERLREFRPRAEANLARLLASAA
jgi:hypothetical protein